MNRALYLGSILLATALAVPSPAQPASWKLWSTYKDIGAQDWSPVGVKTAPDGTFFALGWSDNTTLLEHFSDSGGLQWSKLIQAQTGNSYQPFNLAVTPSSVYVATMSAGSFVFLSRFDYTGHLLWEKRIANTGHSSWLQLAPGPSDSVYLSWAQGPIISPPQLDLARISSTGAILWLKSVGTLDFGPLTSDSDGNVIIGMYGADATFQKYTPEGTQLWSITYDDPSHDDDAPFGLTTDSSNNIYASVFYSLTATMAVKFSSNGTKVWDTSVNVAGPAGISVNSQGTVLVGNFTRSVAELNSSGAIDFQSNPGSGASTIPTIDDTGNVYMYESTAVGSDVRKVDTTGAQLWQVAHPVHKVGTISLDSSGRAIAFDTEAKATSDPGLPSANLIGLSALGASDGSEIWSSHPLVAGSDDSIRHSVTDANGNTYVAGGMGLDVSSSFFVRSFVAKYTSTGVVAWTNDVNLGRIDAMVLDQTGNLIVTYDGQTGPNNSSQSRARKFTSSGAILWDKLVGTEESTSKLLADSSNNILAIGFSPVNAEVAKLDPNGAILWDKTYADLGVATAASMDSTGGFYVGSTNAQTTHAILARISSTGSETWNEAYGIPNSEVRSLLVGSGDIVYAVGNDSVLGSVSRPYVTKIMPNGTSPWLIHPIVAGNPYNHVSDATMDTTGIYMTGGTNGGSNLNVFTAKVQLNGGIAWVKSYDSGSEDQGLFVRNTPNGVFVAGQNRVTATAANYLLIRYAPADGSLLFPNSGDVFTNGAIFYDSRNDQDILSGFGTDAKGNAYLAGISRSPNRSFDAHVVKYGPTDSDVFVTQSVPSTMIAGHTYQVSISFMNTGNTTWSEALKYRLISQNPGSNTTWGFSRVYLQPLETVAPGATKVWTFTVTAPSAAGTYNFQWRVGRENISNVGVPSPNVSVTVTAS